MSTDTLQRATAVGMAMLGAAVTIAIIGSLLWASDSFGQTGGCISSHY